MNRLLLAAVLFALAAPSHAFSQIRTKGDKKESEKEEKGKKPFNPPRLRGHSTVDSQAGAAAPAEAPKVTQASVTKDGKLDPGTGNKSDQQDVNALIKKAAEKAGGVVAGPSASASASPEVKKKDGPRLRGR